MGGIDSRPRYLRSNLTTVIRTPDEHTTRPNPPDARLAVHGALRVAVGGTAAILFAPVVCRRCPLLFSRSSCLSPSRSSLTTCCRGHADRAARSEPRPIRQPPGAGSRAIPETKRPCTSAFHRRRSTSLLPTAACLNRALSTVGRFGTSERSTCISDILRSMVRFPIPL
jgi:hypothetical protein